MIMELHRVVFTFLVIFSLYLQSSSLVNLLKPICKYGKVMSSTVMHTAPTDNFIVKLKESSTYLLNKRVLNKALSSLASLNETRELTQLIVSPFSVGDCKTVLVACVNTQDLELTNKLLELLDSRKLLTSELLYVGIRYACKKKASQIAHRLLMSCQGSDIQTDTDTVNEVIACLLSTGNIDGAFDILEKLNRKEFGNDVIGDLYSYTQLISHSAGCSFEHHVSSVLKALSLMSQNPAVRPVDENLFVSALKLCLFVGDYVSAAEIFRIYEKYFKIIKVNAYNILFLVYINGVSTFNSSNLSVEAKNNAIRFFQTKITHLIELNMDNSPALANSILRFYCTTNAVTEAKLYFNRMKTLKQHIYTSSSISFSELAERMKDLDLASCFYDDQILAGSFPSTSLSIMAYEYQLERKMLRNMVLLLNTDNYLQEDSLSISKAILLAIEIRQFSIAYSIFTDIFLRQRKNNVDYANKQFCRCLITIIDRFLAKTPHDLLSERWIKEFVVNFASLDFESFCLAPRRSDLTPLYSRPSQAQSVMRWFTLEYMQRQDNIDNNPEGDTAWGIDSIDHPMAIELDSMETAIEQSTRLLSWYRYKVAGYMMMATLLLDRNEPLMAMDILSFMIVDTDKTRSKLQQGLDNSSIPSLAGVVQVAHTEMIFSKLAKLPLSSLSSKRMLITVLKEHRSFETHGFNSKTVNVDIKAEGVLGSTDKHVSACLELEGLVKTALFGHHFGPR